MTRSKSEGSGSSRPSGLSEYRVKTKWKLNFQNERRQPSQGQLPHDDAPKAQGRSPFVDGAAPLCDGPEELKRAVAVIGREVQRRMAELWLPGCFKEIARLRILDAALVELLPDDYAETAGGPAQSSEMTDA